MQRVIGCIMKKPSLISEYGIKAELFPSDYNSRFIQMIFGAINNLYLNGFKEVTTTDVDMYISKFTEQYKAFSHENRGVQYLESAREKSSIENFEFYYNRLLKIAKLREFKLAGIDISEFDTTGDTDPIAIKEKEKRLEDSTASEIGEYYISKIMSVNSKFTLGASTDHVSVGLKDLKESLKKNPAVGLPLNGDIMNVVTKGARLSKYYIKSAGSGAGKSRTMMADACKIACDELYDTFTNKWVPNGNAHPVVFISTELLSDELQTMTLAYISGVDEDNILNGVYTPDEEARVDYAIEVLSRSSLYLVVEEDFTPTIIEGLVINNILQNKCKHIFFDYIHSSPALLAEITKKSGIAMQEYQALTIFSANLKRICNKYGVFLSTGTQTNDSVNDNSVKKGASNIQGSKAIINKGDIGIVETTVSMSEIEKVQEIINKYCGVLIPNRVSYIYKNRRSRYNEVKIWSYVDLGTLRRIDLFMTDSNDRYIPLEIYKFEEERWEKANPENREIEQVVF